MNSFSLKGWVNWEGIRAHLCTLAAAVSFNSTWRVPREAFRYGGVSYLLAVSLTMAVVALPAALLQLALGQLSQQDSVGVWRAVPFFKGVGYIRILISYITSIYSIIYVALSALICLLFAVNNSIPFWECKESAVSLEGDQDQSSEITCMNATFLTPIEDQPEYYLALSMLTILLWIIFPFIFYNPIKLMKRVLYALGPLVLLLMTTVVCSIGSQSSLTTIQRRHDWRHYLESKVWISAVIQALLSSQIAGGFLISSGSDIYSSTNVQRTSWLLVGANLVSCWFGAVFWFSVAGGEPRDESALAVLVQMYKTAENRNLGTTWSLLVFATLFFSGVISMLLLLFPLYDRMRRVGGQGWRIIAFTSSFFGAAAALGVLVGGLPILSLLEDTAVPFLICLATVLEVLALIFIYGWKPLVGDVEFLTGQTLNKPWVWGWFAAPAIVLSLTMWWLAALFLDNEDWTEAPWQAITIVATASVATIVFFAVAVTSVAKQVQFDLIAKFKSSFEPSRHWGPRDPITYYYWLAQRQQNQDSEREPLPPRYSQRQLGQLAVGASLFHIFREEKHMEEST